jgi:hypothetical protein
LAPIHAERRYLELEERPARLTSTLLAAAFSLVVACGGATSHDPDIAIDAGDRSDADDRNDAGDRTDAAHPADTGTNGDAGRPECDSSVVTCRSLPPTCPTGEVPVVAGTCWAGHCVKASICRSVKDCTVCTADTDVCAVDSARSGPISRCVEVPPVCANDRTCKCLGSFACTTPAFNSCAASGDRQFQCTCPNC